MGGTNLKNKIDKDKKKVNKGKGRGRIRKNQSERKGESEMAPKLGLPRINSNKGAQIWESGPLKCKSEECYNDRIIEKRAQILEQTRRRCLCGSVQGAEQRHTRKPNRIYRKKWEKIKYHIHL